MTFSEELKNHIMLHGASDVGFFRCDDGPFNYGISIIIRLSESIISEITDKPTLTYFNHYRQVNAFIDQLLLKTGLYLQRSGYKYITIPASQSDNSSGWNFAGRYSHKKGACLSGLGYIGKNSLFIHKEFGSLVRMGTLFTDCPLDVNNIILESECGECELCKTACPAGAITGNNYYSGINRDDMFYPEKCSEYMKRNFQHIGRGAVCGICMKVCPKNKL